MQVSVIVLAAGQGTRMNSDLPKVLHQVAAAPLLHHALATAHSLEPVAHRRRHRPRRRGRRSLRPRLSTRRSKPSSRTPNLAPPTPSPRPHPFWPTPTGEAIVLYADTPLIREETLRAMLDARARHAVVVLGFHAADPGRYGRLLTEGDDLLAIREFKDATPEERAITLCNSGVICAEAKTLFSLVAEVENDNAAGEYYLTDIVELARKRGLSAGVVLCDEAETLGVNTRAQLAEAEAAFQARARAEALGKRRHPDRPRNRVLRAGHPYRPRRDHRPERPLRPRRHRRIRRRDQGLLPSRRLPHQPRRHCRPLRPPAPRRGTGRGCPCRQLRRNQERHPRRRREGRPPDLYRRRRHAASIPTSARAPSPATTTA